MMRTVLSRDAVHHHYFDHAWSDWQCLECDTSTDFCTGGGGWDVGDE